MSSKDFKYLYGPVPSRRLGRSLGVDLVPFKTCTYDCIYCQLGKTTDKTTERRDYVPVADVLREVQENLSTGAGCDYICMAGSGEPTLHASIGEMISKIREMTDIPVAVITNGSLLYLPDVRQSLLQADLVIPSLDAGDAPLFDYVNRPHEDITFERMAEGLVEFARRYSGRLWLEVLLVSGVTGLSPEVKKIAAWAQMIGAQKIQLGTVNRPAYEDFACAVGPKQMKKLAGLFSGPVDILENALPETVFGTAASDINDADILNLLARRPCTLTGICSGLVLHPHDAAKRLGQLADEKRIVTLRTDHDVFYKITEKHT